MNDPLPFLFRIKLLNSLTNNTDNVDMIPSYQ